MPQSAGTCLKNCSNASNPPAEAPIPTTGNDGEASRGLAGGSFALEPGATPKALASPVLSLFIVPTSSGPRAAGAPRVKPLTAPTRSRPDRECYSASPDRASAQATRVRQSHDQRGASAGYFTALGPTVAPSAHPKAMLCLYSPQEADANRKCAPIAPRRQARNVTSGLVGLGKPPCQACLELRRNPVGGGKCITGRQPGSRVLNCLWQGGSWSAASPAGGMNAVCCSRRGQRAAPTFRRLRWGRA